MPIDAATAITLDAATTSVLVAPNDAATMLSTHVRDAGRTHAALDAHTIDNVVDAAMPMAVAIDAALPIDAAVAQPGAIIVVSDAWCDVTIDNVGRGQKSPAPLPVAAGHHVVLCAQSSTGLQWTQPVDVAPGQTVTVRGSLLATVSVKLAVRGHSVTLDGIAFRSGTIATIKAGHIEVVDVGMSGAWAKAYLDIRTSCTLRDTNDQLTCDP